MRENSELTLRKQKDFQRIYNKGKSKGSKYVVILYRNNNLGFTRTAFVSSKKVGNSVKRNHSRRLMRESYFSIRDKVIKGQDIIFVARNTINEAKKQDVQRSMYGAMKACGLIDVSKNSMKKTDGTVNGKE
jgi:ribonuclease P protein component